MVTGITSNPYSLTGLTAATSYDWYVRADCGSGSYSSWVGESTFTTECDVISTFPFTEEFEGTVPPDCWSEVRTPSTSSYGWISNSSGYSGNCARFDSYLNSSGNVSELQTNTFDLSSLTTARLKFYYKNPTGGDFSVLLSTDGGATYPNTLFSGLTGQTDWTEQIANITSYIGNNVKIAFKGTSNYGSGDAYIYLDNVVVEAIPATPIFSLTPASKDFGTLVTSTTSPVQTFTITNSGGGTLTIASGGITLTGTDAGEFTLNDGNTYPINMGAGESVTVDIAFSPTSEGAKSANLQIVHNATGTPSTAALTGTALPEGSLFESFEGSTFPPAGWSVDASTWTQSYSSYDGSKCAYNYNYGAVTDEKLITPKVSILTGDELKFYAKNSSGSDEKLQIRYSPDKTTWTDIGSEITLTSTWTEYTIDLSSLNGNNYHLAFSATSASTSYNYFYVDYVMGPVIYTEVPGPATIGAPADLATDVEINTTLTWSVGTTGGIPDGYKLYFGTDGGGTSTPTNIENGTVQTSPYTPGSLLAYSTTYYWQVVPYNSAGDASGCPIWSFTTLDDPTLTPPFSQDFEGTFPPDNYTRFSGLLANPSTLTPITYGWIQDDWRNISSPVNKAARLNIYGTSCKYWLITPPIDLGTGNNYQLEFDLTLNDYGTSNPPELDGTDDKFAVIISTDNGLTWTSANTLMLWDNAGADSVYNDIDPNGATMIIDLSAYSGIVKIGFYGESTVSNADNDLMVDNLKVRVPPTCLEPTDLTASDITSTSAILGWTDNGGATQWKIMVGSAGFDTTGVTPVTVNTNPSYTASGLSARTSYDWYVMAVCNPFSGIHSTWVKASPFTTAFGVPFGEDFSDGYPPDDWTEAQGKPATGTYSSWTIDGFANVGTTGSAKVRVYGSYTDEWMFTPAIDLGTGGYTLEFDLALTDYANSNAPESIGDDDMFQVFIITDTDTTLLQEWTNTTTPKFADIDSAGQTVVLSLPYTGVRKIGFYAESTVSNADNDLFVDNVVIYDPTAAPSCTTPVVPLDVATGVSAYGILEWASSVGADGYYLWFGDDNPPTNIENGTDLGNVTSYSYSALNYGTTYNWKIVPYNTNGSATGCSVWSFTTMSDPTITAIPHCEYFDGVTAPEIPFGWTVVNNSSNSYVKVETSSTYSNSPDNSVYFYNYGDITADIMLVSPPFDISTIDLATKQVRFMGRGSTSNYFVEVGTMSNPADPATFTILDTIILDQSSFVEHTLYLLDWNGTDKFVAFRHGQKSTYQSIYLDDICFEDQPDCLEPKDLVVSDITSSTALLGWTEQGQASSWEIEYDTTGFTQGTGTVIPAGTNPFTVSNLEVGYTYDWYVRADCGSGSYSYWTGPATFTTIPSNDSCAYATTIICNETLSGTTVGATFDDVSTCGTSNTSPGVWYYFAGTGDFISLSTCDQADFDTKISVFTGDCDNLVCIGGNDDGTGCTGNTSYYEFPSEAGTDYYILVHGFSLQVGIFDLTLNCTPIFTVSGTITYANSAMTPMDHISVSLDTNGVSVATVETDGLGYYEFLSVFEDSYTIGASTSKERGGTQVGDMNVVVDHILGSGALTGIQFASADINVDGSVNVNDYNGMVDDILGSSSGWAAPDWVFEEPTVVVAGSDMPNQDFQALCSGDPDGSFTPSYDCAVPTDLGVGTITTTTAELTWTGESSLSDIIYGAAGFDPLLTGTYALGVTTPYTISGLSPVTEYDFYVRDDCSANQSGSVSDWVGPYTFTTACPPAVNTFPFTESFETSVPPNCWSITEVSWDGVNTHPLWAQYAGTRYPSGNAAQDGTYVAYFNSFSCHSGNEARLETPNLDISGLTACHLTFYMFHNNGYENNDDRLQIQVYNGTSWVNVGTPISRYSTTNGWVLHTVDLSAYVGSTIKVGFLGISEYGHDVHIDNVTIAQP
jgi:hypothetical protein